MQNRILLFLLMMMAGVFVGNVLIAQVDTTNDNVPPRLRPQQDEFENGNYLFPAQKRSNWAVGVMLGSAIEASDIHSTLGYGIGLNIQKALGHVFSLRGQGTAGVMTGQNFQPTKGYYSGGGRNPWVTAVGANPLQYGGNPNLDTTRVYWNPKRDIATNGAYGGVRKVYYNYRTAYYDMSLQGVFNLNNINFYKDQNKWNMYVAVGGGLMAYNTMADVLDNDKNIYNFDKVKNMTNYQNFFSFSSANGNIIKEIFKIRGVKGQIDNLNKKHYEALGESDASGKGLNFGKYKDANGNSQKRYFTIVPFVNASLGVSFRVSRRIDLGIEHRVATGNTDLLDGQRWQENGVKYPFQFKRFVGNTALTSDADAYHFTALTMNIRLGKGEESLWWSNPLSAMYGSLSDTRKLVKNVSEDADGDGVPDLFDQEPDTPDGEIVDSKGRTMDSDEDGVPDTMDEERFTPRGCDVDNRGVALDGDGDKIPDCYDEELASAAGAQVDSKGRSIKMPTLNCTDCTKGLQAQIDELKARPIATTVQGTTTVVKAMCNLPSTHFDLDRTNIKQEFYPQLYLIARHMIDNPTTRIRVSGYTDRGGEIVARRRVENVINFLVGNFAIDRGRFETMYIAGDGVGVYTGGTSIGGKAPQIAPLDYMNRRVDFSCIE